VLELTARQHALVTAAQLRSLGLSRDGIRHRLRRGRLHEVRRGVYSIGRPQLTRYGEWLAAVLSCGPEAVLSHETAGVLWRMLHRPGGPIEVSVSAERSPRARGIRVHRRRALSADERTEHLGVPVTTVLRTLVDLATRLDRDELEAAINQADKLDLTDPESLRSQLEGMRGPGVAALRKTLDRRTFVLTESALERRFLPIARRAGLPRPLTGQWVNGFKVDFYWPDLELVVETDGLRYHRTPAQQARDRQRDQGLTAAGLTVLRFTHAQVAYEPNRVEEILNAVAYDAGAS
jgi:very-short-patch-repair endonuclease